MFKVSQWPWVVSRCRPGELRMALIPSFLSQTPTGPRATPCLPPLSGSRPWMGHLPIRTLGQE